MAYFICATCGVQYDQLDAPPERCEICEDARQYVRASGQEWTTLENLRAEHRNTTREKEPGLFGIGTVPEFGIGQRALLVQSEGGNVLWDCISLVDEETVAAIEGLGGISAIAVSHPHYYSSVVEWSRAFGGAPVYLHAADRRWVMRPDPSIVFWDEETLELAPGFTLIRCGGHFEGGSVLHWGHGAEGRGALLSGDIVQVVADTRWVSFMYSYPNYIPLPAESVRRISETLEPYPFERIYGAWWGKVVQEDGKGALARSADRYVAALGGNL